MTVKFNQVSKRFGNVEAIRKLSLDLPDHGTLAIMGPSGCGKTTLLHLLAGLTAPGSGVIRCDAKRIAYVFQEPRLLPWRTVEDNIRLARADDRHAPTRSVRAWLSAMGIENCGDRYPEELSGGMRQRVAIARALYCDSDLLLLDEPFRGLDEETRDSVMTLVRQVRSAPDQLTLLVTHDRREAIAIADAILTFSSAPASDYHMEALHSSEQ